LPFTPPAFAAARAGAAVDLALQDQQYPGLIMWIGGRLVYLHVIARRFLDWMRQSSALHR
jgi:cytochrome c oxidase assembly factor CtaG